MSTNNKISNIVSSQLPFFVRNDHPTFAKFVEAYYEYMEQDGKTIDVAKNLRNYIDIDQSVDIFAEKLYDNFIKLIPKNIVADKSLVLKHVKDFYAAKGTEKATAFLLNILSGDSNTSFYYPKRDILRASDGKWFIEKSLKVKDFHVYNNSNIEIDTEFVTVKDFVSKKITGIDSTATATVESVDLYYENGILINELKISNQVRDFASTEQIIAYHNFQGVDYTLKANIISGIITSVSIETGGNNYTVGTIVPIESNSGSGGVVSISSVTSGSLLSIQVMEGGAGFQNNMPIIFTADKGSGANAHIQAVVADGYYHPNTYNIVISLIASEANTVIGNTTYANLSNSITDPANSSIANTVQYWTYANTGPVQSILLLATGADYNKVPVANVDSNVRIKQLGVLGKMKIVSPGQGYANGDIITFTNVPGGYGVGAAANIAAVNATGAIQKVQFVPVPGHLTGGAGYTIDKLPTVSITSANGTNGVVVVSTLLGYGDVLSPATDSIGKILSLRIDSGGVGYLTAPTLNLQSFGDGTAQASAKIVSGIYTYPGRYLNDDGHLSAYNFLQDRDYYHNYSYVIKVKESIDNYRKALKNLVHPSGLKVFGEYLYVQQNTSSQVGLVAGANGTANMVYHLSTYNYTANTTNVTIGRTAHGLSNGSTIYIEMDTGGLVNVGNGIFVVSGVINSNSYVVRNNNLSNVAYSATGNVYVALYK